MPKVTDSESTNEEGEQDEPVKVLQKQATFGEYMVWGHEMIPAADDTFVKGVEEWVKFAEAVCYSSPLALIFNANCMVRCILRVARQRSLRE